MMNADEADASGTKPTQLNNPVPGVDQEAANTQAVDTYKAPRQRAPAAAPQQKYDLSAFGGNQPQQEAPAQQAQPSSNKYDLSSFGQSAPQQQPSSDQQAQPQSYEDAVAGLDRFSGKEIESSILGMKIKQDKDGQILMKGWGGGGWKAPSETQRDTLGKYLSAIKDIYPMAAGAVAGEATGAAGGAALGPPGAAVGLVAGGAAGAYAGASHSKDHITSYLQDEENAKNYYLMGKLTGDQSDPMTPETAAITQGIGNIFGSVLGQSMKSIGGNITSKSAAEQITADQMAPGMSQLSSDVQRTGVPLTAVEAGSSLNNPGAAGQYANEVSSGSQGSTLKTEFNNAVNDKIQKTNQFLNDLKNKFAPNVDYSQPSKLELAQSSAEGFNRGPQAKNAISNVIDNYGQAVGSYRPMVQDIIGNVRGDDTRLISDVSGVLKQIDPSIGESLNAKDFNSLRSNLRQNAGDSAARETLDVLGGFYNHIGTPDTEFAKSGISKMPISSTSDVFPDVAEKYSDARAQFQEPLEGGGGLMNASTGQSVGASPGSAQSQFMDIVGGQQGSMTPGIAKPGLASQNGPEATQAFSSGGEQPGLPGQSKTTSPNPQDTNANTGIGTNNAGEASHGITFDYLTNFTDKLQDISSRTDNPYIQQLAGAFRSYEADWTAGALKSAGKDGLAREVAAAKEIYSSNIDQLSTLQKGLAKNLHDVGGWVTKLPAESIRILQSFMPKDQFEQLAGAGIRSSIVEDMLMDPTSRITSSSLNSKFLGNAAKRESMEALIGPENVQNLESGMRVLGVLEKQNLSPAGLQKQAGIAGRFFHGIEQIGTDITNFALYGKPDAAKAVKTAITDYRSLYSNRGNVGKAITEAAGPVRSGTSLTASGLPVLTEKTNQTQQ